MSGQKKLAAKIFDIVRKEIYLIRNGRPQYIKDGEYDNDLILKFSETNYFCSTDDYFVSNIIEDTNNFLMRLKPTSQEEKLNEKDGRELYLER